jgi:uncharacterized iron-regulated protein
MREFKVTEQDVSKLHNARVYLLYALEKIDEMFKEDSSFVKNMRTSMEYLAPVSKRLMDEVDKIREDKHYYYMNVCKENNFSTVWSYYDVDDLYELAVIGGQYVNNTTILTSETDYEVEIQSSSESGFCKWIDLWKAADRLVTESGDSHYFIEQFRLDPTTNKVNVFLGS